MRHERYIIQGLYDDWIGWQDIDSGNDYAVMLVRYDQYLADETTDLRMIDRPKEGHEEVLMESQGFDR